MPSDEILKRAKDEVMKPSKDDPNYSFFDEDLKKLCASVAKDN